MFSLKLSLSSSILCVFLCINSHAAPRTDKIWNFDHEWGIPKDDYLTFDRFLSKSDNTFLFATCHEISKTEGVNCTFVLKNLLYSYLRQNQRVDMTCNSTLVPSNENRVIDINKISVERFITDSIFFSWAENDTTNDGVSYYKYGHINMPKCEIFKVKELEASADQKEQRLQRFVMYRNMFDVIDYKNSSGESCDQKLCRFPNSLEKSDKIGSFPADLNAWSIQPVNYDDDDDGFFALSANDTFGIIANHVDKSGKVVPLFTVPKPVDTIWIPHYSRYRLSACWTPLSSQETLLPGKLHCTQYSYHPSGLQSGANFVLNVTNVGKPWDQYDSHSEILALQNLSDEGLLILTGKCQQTDGSYACKQLKALKINEKGLTRGSTGLNDPFNLPDVDFGCPVEENSMKVDIRNEINHHAFFFAAICKEGAEKENIIKFKRVDVNYYD